MNDAREALPELPRPDGMLAHYGDQWHPDWISSADAWDSDAMQAYGTACAKAARRAALEEAAKVCDERCRRVADAIPSLPPEFRGADSFANGSLQQAEACASAIRAIAASGAGKL